MPAVDSGSEKPQHSAAAAADDYALMAGIATRDSKSLVALYDRYSSLLYGVCLRILRDRADADELLIDLFWEFWDRSDRYDPARGSPLTYLLTVARSRALDRRRARPHRLADTNSESFAAAAQEDASSAPLASAVANEWNSRVLRALAELDQNEREAIELSFLDDLSHSEIAARLKKPLGTVKTYIRQGLIRLRRRLRNY